MKESLTKQLETMPLRGRGVRLSDADYNQWWINRVRANTTFAEDGCWVWNGNVGTKGYGSTGYRGKTCAVHRRAYKILTGVELATEQFVCHKCDRRRCWNPAHLFIGDAAANNRDCGNKGRHHNGVKTHCKRGHEFTPENTYLKVTPTTVMRACLQCQKIRASSPRYREKSRENARRQRARRRSQVTV